MTINAIIVSTRLKKLSAFACIFSLSLAACSSGDSSTQETGNSTQQASGALEGTWDLCGAVRNTYVFRGNTWEQYLADFDTPDCSGAPLPSENLPAADEPFASGTFELLNEVTADSGVVAQELNLLSTTFTSGVRYDIVFTGTPGELVFGTFAGFTEEDRPVTLDFDAVYIRR